jgi:hypothetical protein
MPPFSIQPPAGVIGAVSGISSTLAWILFGIMALVALIFTFILDYHWRNFDFSFRDGVKVARRIYYIGLGIIFLTMISSLIITII